MKRALVAGALCAVMAQPAAAAAKEMSGRAGLGADTSLGFGSAPSTETSSAPGLSVRYQATSSVGVQLIGYYRSETFTNTSGVEISSSYTEVTARVMMEVLGSRDTAVAALGGLIVGKSGYGELDPKTDVGVEIGLRVEWFATDFLSLHTQAGFAIALITEDETAEQPGGTAVNLFGNGDLLGNAGVTFWFP